MAVRCGYIKPYHTHPMEILNLEFQKEHISVCISEPRVLVVSVSAPLFEVCLIVLHAPHSTSVVSQAEWITLVSKQVSKYVSDRPTTVFIDANAQLHADTPLQSGSFRLAGKSPESSDSFIQFITDTKHEVINTYSDNCKFLFQGSEGTVQPSRVDYTIRLDYLLSSQFVCVPGSCFVAKECCPTHAVEDHYPVTATVVPPLLDRNLSPVLSRAPTYDRDGCSNSSNIVHFNRIIQHAPCIPHNIELTAHAHILQAQVLSALDASFPLRSFQPRRQRQLSRVTQQCVSYGKCVRKALWSVRRRWHVSSTFCCFQVWARKFHRCGHSSVLGFCKPGGLPQYLYLRSLFRTISQHTKSYLILDDQAAVLLASEELDASLGGGDLNTMHRIIKTLPAGKFISRPTKRTCDSQGLPSKSREHEKCVVREYVLLF